MATLVSRASGNFTASATWAVCSSAAENDTVATTTALTTSNQDSSTFILAATAVDGFAVRVMVCQATVVGTVTITLRNSTTATDALSVTINAQDLFYRTADAQGWIFFSTGGSITPNGTDSYLIRAVRSSATGTLSLASTATTNWARQVRTTTQQAPAVNDKLLIAGQFTGAAASTRYTVTLDNTATTSFGPTAGTATQGISINDKGTLQLGSTAATAYYLKMKGELGIFAGGEFLADNPTGASGTITGATSRGLAGRVIDASNANPLVITSPGHGLSTGDVVVISGVSGNTNANGTFQIANVTTNTFSLQNSSGTDIAGNGVNPYPNMPSGDWFAPVVVTSTAHGLSTGDTIFLKDAVPSSASAYLGINGVHQVTNWTTNTFILNGASTATATAWSSGGTWTKRGALVSSSSFVLEFDASVATVDSGMNIYSSGVCYFEGASKTSITKMTQQTTIGSDANSLNSLVDTTAVANSVVTWKEGRKFDPAWTGGITINGTAATITGTPTTTSLTVTSNLGALTGVTAAKTGTGAQVICKVDDTTGWVAGDSLCFGSSGKNGAGVYTISTVDSSTQVTLTAGATGYHSALNDTNGDMRAFVANMTRNVRIRGLSTTNCGYVNCSVANSVMLPKVCFKNTEVYKIGSATAGKRGLGVNGSIANTGIAFYLINCALHDTGTSGALFSLSATPTAQNCIPYCTGTSFVNSAAGGFCVNAGTNAGTAYCLFDSCFFAPSTGAVLTTAAVTLTHASGGRFSNNFMSGAGGSGSSTQNLFIVSLTASAMLPVFYGNTFIGGGTGNSGGITLGSTAVGASGVIGNGTSTPNNFYRLSGTSSAICVILGSATGVNTGERVCVNGMNIAGCGYNAANSCQLVVGYDGDVEIDNLVADSGSNIFPTGSVGIQYSSGPGKIIVDGALLGQKTTFLGNDVAFSALNAVARYPKVVMRNCKFSVSSWCKDTSAGGTLWSSTSFPNGVVSLKHNQTSGTHSMYKAHQAAYSAGGTTVTANFYGRIDTDSVVYRTAAPSAKMAPNSTNGATSKLQSPIIRVPVNSGTTISPSVYVRKSSSGAGDSASYNGAQPRLIILADSSIGITTDTVLATGSASVGNWEQLTGTSASFTGSGVARLIIDCDGTTGFINIDDFSCAGTPSTLGTSFWGEESFGVNINGEPTGSGGGMLVHPGYGGW